MLTYVFFLKMQLYTGPNMFVAYCTKTDSSPCDFYKMTLVAAFGFLMALSELRAPPLPQPSKFSRFKVLLTSYQASRSRSHQQAKQRLAASKGHIEGRRREGQRWAKQDDGSHSANFNEKVHKPQSKSYGRIGANMQLIFTHIL